MQKKYSVHYAGAISVIAVIAFGAFVYAQQSFRQQVQDAVVEKTAASLTEQLLAGEALAPANEPMIAGGSSMAPVKVDIFGTLTENTRQGSTFGAPTTTVGWFWLNTSTEPLSKVVAIPDNYDRAALFIMAKASTTLSRINITVQGSWNGYDWFSFRQATTSGDTLNLEGTTTVAWIPGDTATRTALFSDGYFDDVRAPYYRFTIQRGPGVADNNGRYQAFIMFYDNK